MIPGRIYFRSRRLNPFLRGGPPTGIFTIRQGLFAEYTLLVRRGGIFRLTVEVQSFRLATNSARAPKRGNPIATFHSWPFWRMRQ